MCHPFSNAFAADCFDKNMIVMRLRKPVFTGWKFVAAMLKLVEQ
jgi:hypothetical protein